jgi:hypothetical protein
MYATHTADQEVQLVSLLCLTGTPAPLIKGAQFAVSQCMATKRSRDARLLKNQTLKSEAITIISLTCLHAARPAEVPLVPLCYKWY